MSFKKILLIVIIGVGLITLGGMLIVYSFMDIKLSSVDGKGELVKTVESPNGIYQADTFMVYGNTADKNQVRVSITNMKDKLEFNDTTVYWLYPAKEALPEVDWISDEKLNVADKEINIKDKKTYYNYRKDQKSTE